MKKEEVRYLNTGGIYLLLFHVCQPDPTQPNIASVQATCHTKDMSTTINTALRCRIKLTGLLEHPQPSEDTVAARDRSLCTALTSLTQKRNSLHLQFLFSPDVGKIFEGLGGTSTSWMKTISFSSMLLFSWAAKASLRKKVLFSRRLSPPPRCQQLAAKMSLTGCTFSFHQASGGQGWLHSESCCGCNSSCTNI